MKGVARPTPRTRSLRTKLKRVADVGPEYRAAMEAGAGLELVGDLLLAKGKARDAVATRLLGGHRRRDQPLSGC